MSDHAIFDQPQSVLLTLEQTPTIITGLELDCVDIPFDWLVLNAARPLMGHKIIHNSKVSLFGRYYAGIDFNDFETAKMYLDCCLKNGASIIIRTNEETYNLIAKSLIPKEYAEKFDSLSEEKQSNIFKTYSRKLFNMPFGRVFPFYAAARNQLIHQLLTTNSMKIPCLSMPIVYHVGDLKSESRGRQGDSLEGHLLSVSNCPDAWMQIAKLGNGDIKEVSLKDSNSEMLFLDILSVKDHPILRETISQWGIENGFLKESVLWRSYNWDSESKEWTYASCLCEDEARGELWDPDGLGPDNGSPVQSVNALVGTERMANAILKHDVHRYDCFEYAAILWAQLNVPSLCGAWWDEDLDVYSYSAPRGGIFPDQMYRFEFSNMDLSEIDSFIPEKKLLDESFVKDTQSNVTVIAGYGGGIQSCSLDSANIFVRMGGITHYCVMDRNKRIVNTDAVTPTVKAFFTKNQVSYENFCLTFDNQTKPSIRRNKIL